MKYLVVDTRDNSRFFGEVASLDNATESAFNFDKTDVITIGSGSRQVAIPALAARSHIGVTSCPIDAINCDE